MLLAGAAPAAGAQIVLGIGTPPDNVVRAQFSLAVGASGNVSAMAVSGLPQTVMLSTPLTWSSSDTSVASLMMINPITYMVTGKKDGVATIRYTSQYGSASVDVAVGAGAPVVATAMPTRTLIGTVATAPTTSTTTTTATAPTTSTTLATTATRTPITTATTTRTATTLTGTRTLAGATIVPGPTRAAPTGFAAQAIGAGKVAFSWRSVPGAAGYLVTSSENHTVSVPGGTATSAPRAIFTDTAFVTALAAGTKTYRVAPVYLKSGTTLLADESNAELTNLHSNTATVTIPRWSGRYRVTLNGFKVVQETLDNPLEVDGKRDEVYFKSTAQEFDSLGNAVGAMLNVRSRTHGDVNYADWQNPGHPAYRVKAGGASTLGGLMTNNGYPTLASPWVNGAAPSDRQLPLILWDGWLVEDGNAVVISPTVWEDDAKPDAFAPERELVQAMGRYVTRRFLVPVQLASGSAGGIGRILRYKLAVQGTIIPGSQVEPLIKAGLLKLDLTNTPQYEIGLKLASMAAAGLQQMQASLQANLELAFNAKDRPIGMMRNANGSLGFEPVMLNLSYENVEGLIDGGGLTGKGPGIIEVPYVDTSGNGGNYILYLQVHRLQ